MSAKLIETGMVLYTKKDHHISHRVRLAMAHKHLAYRLVLVDDAADDGNAADVADLNPYNTLPVLVDRELVLYEQRVIIDYVEERFKGVKLLPDSPDARAKVRQLAWRIEKDWLYLADILLTHADSMSDDKKDKARQSLTNSLTTMSPLFGHQPYFLSEHFGLCDCLLAPALYRLDEMGVALPAQHCRALLNYMQRVFSLESFRATV